MEITINKPELISTQNNLLYLYVKPFYFYEKGKRNDMRSRGQHFKKHYHKLFSYSYADKNTKEDIKLKYLEKIKLAEPLVLEFIKTLGLTFSARAYITLNSFYLKKIDIQDVVDFKFFSTSLLAHKHTVSIFKNVNKYNIFSLFMLEIFIKNFLYEKRNIIPYNQDYLDFFKRAILFYRDKDFSENIFSLSFSNIIIPIFTHNYSDLYLNKLTEIINITYI